MNYILLLRKLFVIACLACIGNQVNAQTIPSIDQLKPGESIIITYDVTVNGGTPSGTVITNSGTVTATNASNASTNTSNLVVVTCPEPTITTSGPASFCAGGVVTLTAVPGDPLDPAQSYQWYRDGVIIVGATTA